MTLIIPENISDTLLELVKPAMVTLNGRLKKKIPVEEFQVDYDDDIYNGIRVQVKDAYSDELKKITNLTGGIRKRISVNIMIVPEFEK